jgi:hypothetical protein
VREFHTCRITSISDRGGNRAPRGQRSVGPSQPPQTSHRGGAGRGGAGRVALISHSRRSRHEFVASKMPTRPISIPPARARRPLSARAHSGQTARRRARAPGRRVGGSGTVDKVLEVFERSLCRGLPRLHPLWIVQLEPRAGLVRAKLRARALGSGTRGWAQRRRAAERTRRGRWWMVGGGCQRCWSGAQAAHAPCRGGSCRR